MITPPYLQEGDTVAIAATARKVSKEEMRDAIALLENWGLQVLVQPDLFAEQNQFAGSDKHRANAFNKLLANEKVKAIFCARGGYGTVRMVDDIDIDLLRKHPKWVIGFSDITVLIAHFYQSLGLNTIHGPMPLNMQQAKQHVESLMHLKDTIFKGPQEIWFKPNPLNTFDFKDANANTLMGGNLSVLYAMLGSNSFPKLNNCWLFLEDLDEYLYHIDRMMQGLKRAGVLNHIKGFIIGDMSDMKDNAIPFGKTAYEIILETAESLQKPVVFGMPSGHEPHHMSLVMGHAYALVKKDNQVGLVPTKNTI